MNHTITTADVQRIFSEESAATYTNHLGDFTKTRAEALQGTRTRVHELLQEQVPCSYQADPPSKEEMSAVGEKRNILIAARRAKLSMSIPDSLVLESERARNGPDGTHKDAVHYVQKLHGKALWAEADRLVAVAGLGGVS